MSKLITGIFESEFDVRSALVELDALGFKQSQVSMVAADKSVGQTFGLEKSTKATEGGAVGAVTGGLIGAVVAGLTSTATLVIPGLNLLVFGTLLSAAVGAGAGAVAGGLTGSLIGLGLPEFQAKHYEEKIKGGSILLAVETSNSEQVDLVKNLFEKHNGLNVS